ncbi:M57 family metalloprotease [Sphingobacterium spiritivorum]|uniref:Protease B family protein n=1 Tax=Sphingobacterium spiritivorum ATCC 33861 TaxID=525373 RepID=D7VRJ7_SPHSI|nr:M57 family metalloprotease [Sphingobacterium spiritivorum]EFK56398.1 protease B family protein [Sphingobacterium spiritivorum ATCC 33861]QQT35523.1 hypothetical protein I6J01_19975 [Sphingobacterium spiritivorum]WQD32219.1 M57 family metalloprotease [Sphingobacterium spiritivorum]SUJ06764.1 Dual-action HEIGH metallo-peptidase [Sphingobacterium spiritivorum]
MKNYVFMFFIVLLFSCNKNDELTTDNNSDSKYIEKLKNLGFDLSEGFYQDKNGYTVEYDIFLSKEDIDYFTDQKDLEQFRGIELNKLASINPTKLDVKKISQYRTTEMVNYISVGGLRSISIYLDPSLNNVIGNQLNVAIQRYNDLELALIFERTQNPANANIKIVSVYDNSDDAYLMKAGFPKNGSPFNEILVNTYFYNSSTTRNDVPSTLAHEIGHCIGLRHTDYMNRVFSCGVKPGKNPNEGSGNNGAVHITGTPNTAENNSYMLACISGSDRPFTSNDIIALKTLYNRERPYIREDRQEEELFYDSYSGSFDIRVTSTFSLFKDKAMTQPYTKPYEILLMVGYTYYETYNKTKYNPVSRKESFILQPGTNSVSITKEWMEDREFGDLVFGRKTEYYSLVDFYGYQRP